MPKIPKKPKKVAKKPTEFVKKAKLETDGRLETRLLANKLLSLCSDLSQVREELNNLWELLYTKGLTELGPITEDRDDIPF